MQAKYSMNKGLHVWPFTVMVRTEKSLISSVGRRTFLEIHFVGSIPRFSPSSYFLFDHRGHCSLKSLMAPKLLKKERLGFKILLGQTWFKFYCAATFSDHVVFTLSECGLDRHLTHNQRNNLL